MTEFDLIVQWRSYERHYLLLYSLIMTYIYATYSVESAFYLSEIKILFFVFCFQSTSHLQLLQLLLSSGLQSQRY